MPTARPPAPTRPGSTPGSRWSRLRARVDRANGADGDAGFTMVEMIVALVIIGIVMTAVGSFFVSTVSATSRQGSLQAGAQLAEDAIETVRSLKGTAVIAHRDQNSSDTQWNSPVTGVAAYQTDMIEAYDSTAAIGDGATATLPTTGQPTTVNGLTYTQNWYVGSCWQPLGGGSCGKVATTGYASFYRVVVAVTWNDKVCPSSKCVFIATTLVSNAPADPLFNSNQVATAPTVVNPGNQTNDTGVALTMQLTATGGAGSITWSSSNLPAGLTMTSSGAIAGTPTTVGNYAVVVSATDSFGLIGTGNFTWKIVAPATITATAQSSIRNVADSYTPTASGGVGALTWAATGLPAGLGPINPTTGVIAGTPTSAAVTSTVVLTVTDSQNQPSTASFVWTITAAPILTITTPGAQTSTANTAISTLTVASGGGISPYAWSATGYPTGLTFNSGQFSGTPTVPGIYSVTVTVSDSSTQSVSTSAFSWTVWGIISPPTNLASDTAIAISTITPRAAFGTGTYTWSTTNGTGANKTLPAGLSFNSTTGVISGTPSASSTTTYNFNLVATDTGNSKTSSINITWIISTSPVIVSPNASQFNAVNVAIPTLTATSANFSSTPNWTASGLPTGLSMSSAGAITGTPTAVGVYAVTITATRGGSSDTQSLNWTIESGPVATSPSTNRSTVRNTTIATITAVASGGTGALTWSATGLPAGLSISAAGAISGKTANAASSNNTVLTVTDGYGVTATLSFTWAVT